MGKVIQVKPMRKLNSCPLCGCTKTSLYIKSAGAGNIRNLNFKSREEPVGFHPDFLRCAACEVLFSKKFEDENVFNQVVRGAKYTIHKESALAAKTNFNLVKEYVNRDGSYLEVGCSDGAFLRLLDCESKFGVEPCEMAYDAIPKELKAKVFKGFLSESKFLGSDGVLDGVFCFQSIEHLYNLKKEITLMRNRLKNNGDLFLTLHNYKSLVNQILGVKSPIYDYQHHLIFSPISIKLILEKLGFKVERCQSFINYYPLSYGLRLLKKDLKLGFDPIIPFPVGNLFVKAIKIQ